MRQRIWLIFQLSLASVVVGLHLYAALLPEHSMLDWYTTDDAFYYFKVAQNIISGKGITFDGLNPTNGFQPLWMVVCVALTFLTQGDLILPLRILIVLSGILHAGTSLLLFNFVKRFTHPLLAASAAVLWATSGSIYSSLIQGGMESSLSAFSILLLIFLVTHPTEKPTPFWKQFLIGIVGGLTVLARLDNIYLVLLIGVWFALRDFTPYLRSVILSDLGIIFCTSLLSYYLRLGTGATYLENSASLPWMVALNFLITPLLFLLFELYKPYGEAPSLKFLGRLLSAVSLVSIISGATLILLQKWSVYPSLPRLVIIYQWALAAPAFAFIRILWRWVFRQQHNGADHALAPLIRQNWHSTLRRSAAYFLPVVFLLGTYLLWNYAHFATWMPISGQIKHWWGNWPNTVYGKPTQFGPELFGFSTRGGWFWLVGTSNLLLGLFGLDNISLPYLAGGTALLALASFVLIARSSLVTWFSGALDNAALWALFCALPPHILYYTTTSYIHMRPWYWASETIFLVISLALLGESARLAILRNMQSVQIPSYVGPMALLLLGAFFLGNMFRSVWARFLDSPCEGWHEYIASARWLEAKTPPGALIGITGGGSDAYFIQGRVIVNLDGLINSPAYFDALRSGQAGQFLDRLGLEYVYGTETMLLHSDPYRHIFTGRLKYETENDSMTLYRYLPQTP